MLSQFKRDLPKEINEYYLETIVDLDNLASLAVASKLFGDSDHDGVDKISGEPVRIWKTKMKK